MQAPAASCWRVSLTSGTPSGTAFRWQRSRGQVRSCSFLSSGVGSRHNATTVAAAVTTSPGEGKTQISMATLLAAITSLEERPLRYHSERLRQRQQDAAEVKHALVELLSARSQQQLSPRSPLLASSSRQQQQQISVGTGATSSSSSSSSWSSSSRRPQQAKLRLAAWR